MIVLEDISYVSDENGSSIGVLVPIKLWKELISENETAYILKNEVMKRRILEAKNRKDGLSLEEVCEKLGI